MISNVVLIRWAMNDERGPGGRVSGGMCDFLRGFVEIARENDNRLVSVEKDGVRFSFEEGKDGFVQVIITGRYFGHKFKVYPNRRDDVEYYRWNPENMVSSPLKKS